MKLSSMSLTMPARAAVACCMPSGELRTEQLDIVPSQLRVQGDAPPSLCLPPPVKRAVVVAPALERLS